MAMNIISKEKKEIRWLGLPTNSIQEANGLELDKAKRIDRIKAKTQQLQDLILQVCTNGFSFLKSFRGYILKHFGLLGNSSCKGRLLMLFLVIVLMFKSKRHF